MTRRIRSALTLLLPVFVVAACAPDADDDVDAAAEEAAEAPPAPAPTAVQDETGALLDPSVATRAQLMALEGMDAETVDALMAGRPYDDMLEVDAVLADHMSEAEREELYRRLWLRIDLNEASEEEILLIPGVGERMAHEFDEYRPYDGIERFRREIGKYVDEDEVARLERYVEIR